jgi:iron complex outermembrane recepter protein
MHGVRRPVEGRTIMHTRLDSIARGLAATASLVALALAAPAVAQDTGQDAAPDTAEAEDVAPGEIIVTAQKREQRLQDVPLAVTAISGDKIAEQGGVNLETAQTIIPTLNIQKSGTTLNQSLYMRGVGTATFSIAAEPSVSTVVDGVVYARAGEAFGDLIDIERLEVLRGPQGTLFGKNASAGAINIVTKRPGSSFGGTVEASYFSEDEFRGRVAIDVPFGDDVRSRWTGFYGEYDGNIRNIAVNETVNGYKHYGLRGIVEADLSPVTTLTIIGDWREADDDCCAQLIGTTGTGLAFQVLPTPLEEETRTVNQNLVTRTEETSWGLSAQLDTEIGTHSLTSITAYREWENTEIRDGDWLPQAYIGLNQLHDEGPQSAKTFSQEVRIASPTGQTLEYLVGLYYSNAKNDRVFTRRSILCGSAVTPPPTTPTPCTSPLAAPSRTPTGSTAHGAEFENFAVFANATVNLSDAFRLIGGLRYTIDWLDVYLQRTVSGLDTNAAGAPVATGGINPAFGPFTDDIETQNLSGRAGLQVDVSDDVMAYASYTRGYKGPGYNLFFNLGATGTAPVEAETSDAFEIGLKNTLLDGRATLNFAAFYTKFDNFQANNPDLAGGVVVSRFTNAGKVSTRGFEVDFNFVPVPGLTIGGGGAYTDAKVDAFRVVPGANPADIIPPGTPLLFAPKWKGTLGVDYRGGLSDSLDLFLGSQISGQTEQLSIFSPNATLRERGTIEGYSLVNLSAGLGDSDDRWKILFQLRNVFDTAYVAHKESGGPGGSLRYQIPRDADRYWGVTARFNF